MFLMYVDESGDVGMLNSPTRYFVLTGLVVHELRWSVYLDQIIAFRRDMKLKYGLKLREEVHAAAFINTPGELVRIKKYDRLAILRHFIDLLASMQDINIINIVVDKQDKPHAYNPFEMAWSRLIQRFENTIASRNFPGPANPDERGLLIPDATDDKKLQLLLRRMRRYNPIPQKHSLKVVNRALHYVIEDPFMKDSANSFFIQATDVAAYFLYQHLAPNSYIKSKSGQNYFLRLEPILCKVAAKADPLGIVRL